MSTTIIGGSDGPTSIFLAGKLGMNWLNVSGLIFMVLLLIPNIIYAVKFHENNTPCPNRAMNILEQIGHYASITDVSVKRCNFEAYSADYQLCRFWNRAYLYYISE